MDLTDVNSYWLLPKLSLLSKLLKRLVLCCCEVAASAAVIILSQISKETGSV